MRGIRRFQRCLWGFKDVYEYFKDVYEYFNIYIYKQKIFSAMSTWKINKSKDNTPGVSEAESVTKVNAESEAVLGSVARKKCRVENLKMQFYAYAGHQASVASGTKKKKRVGDEEVPRWWRLGVLSSIICRSGCRTHVVLLRKIVSQKNNLSVLLSSLF